MRRALKAPRRPPTSVPRRVRPPIQHDPWAWLRNGDLWSAIAGGAMLATILVLGLLKAFG